MTAAVQSLTIGRVVGGPLTITNAIPTSGTDFHLNEGGLAFPDFDFRMTWAPDSPDIPGKQLLGYVLDSGTLPLTIYVHGTTTADLQANRRTLEAAFSQDTFELAINVDGSVEIYQAFPAWPKWGAVDSGRVAAHMAVATLSVTVNPA